MHIMDWYEFLGTVAAAKRDMDEMHADQDLADIVLEDLCDAAWPSLVAQNS